MTNAAFLLVSAPAIIPIQKVKPTKASVEFGLEVALEAGNITALLVKGTGTSNLKITLEWTGTSSE